MSRGQKARTPANFPNMKYRARKRHQRTLDRIDIGAVFASLAQFASQLLDTFNESIARIDWSAIGKFGESLRAAYAEISSPCTACEGTGDSNGADWCEECGGTGRRLDAEPEAEPTDDVLDWLVDTGHVDRAELDAAEVHICRAEGEGADRA